MILPTHEHCRKVLDELEGDPELTEFEQQFIESNKDRQFFTPRQREIIAGFMEKYQT